MCQLRLAAVTPLGYDSWFSPLCPQWVRFPSPAQSWEEETNVMTGTRTGGTQPFFQQGSNSVLLPCTGFSVKRTAVAWHGTVRPEVQNGAAMWCHPKPKPHDVQQTGVRSRLCHFQSPAFYCPESDTPTKGFPNSWTGLPLCLWTSSKSTLPKVQNSSFSIHQGHTTLLKCDYRLETGIWTGYTKRWAANAAARLSSLLCYHFLPFLFSLV